MANSGIIRTERLVIRPFSIKYLTPRYVSWLNDREVVRYSQQGFRKHTPAECRRYFESFKGTPHYFWAVTTIDPALGYIGTMNAHVYPRHRQADIGILLGERSAWGKGFGLEAWSAACDYLFRKAGMRKITAGALSVNSRMLSLMKRAGMVPDGRRVRQCIFEGNEVDVIHMAMFKHGK